MADNNKPGAAASKDVNKEPLNAKSTEPQRDATVQAAANQSLEENRGTRFGDNTSSTGDQNTRGLHGRDGGVYHAPENSGPMNPAPDDATVNPDKDGDGKPDAEPSVAETAKK
jgi:hypothetical protein